MLIIKPLVTWNGMGSWEHHNKNDGISWVKLILLLQLPHTQKEVKLYWILVHAYKACIDVYLKSLFHSYALLHYTVSFNPKSSGLTHSSNMLSFFISFTDFLNVLIKQFINATCSKEEWICLENTKSCICPGLITVKGVIISVVIVLLQPAPLLHISFHSS